MITRSDYDATNTALDLSVAGVALVNDWKAIARNYSYSGDLRRVSLVGLLDDITSNASSHVFTANCHPYSFTDTASIKRPYSHSNACSISIAL